MYKRKSKMAQFLRPISDITSTGITGGWADVDEVVQDNGDFLYTGDNSAGTWEGLLSTGVDPLVSTGHIIRLGAAVIDGGVLSAGGGNDGLFQFYLYQGTTLIKTIFDGSITDDGAVVGFAQTLTVTEANSITDYSDLRIRCVFPASGGGSPAIRRGGGIVWAELELPNAAPPSEVLVPQGSTHNHTSDNVAVGSKYSIGAQGSSHSHTAEVVVLVLPHFDIVVNDSTHSQTADGVGISVSYIVTINSATHPHKVDNVVISSKHSLVVNGSSHAHTSENIVLSNSVNLVPEGSSHSHTTENTVLSHKYALAVNGSSHNHRAESIVLQLGLTLLVNDSAHQHNADSVIVTTKYSLSVNGSSHPHKAENVLLELPGVVALTVQGSSHSHASENLVLSSKYELGFLQSEEVDNGTFDTDAVGWQGDTAYWDWIADFGGAVRITKTTVFARLTQFNRLLTAGAWYKLSYTVHENIGEAANINYYNGAIYVSCPRSVGNHEVIYQRQANTTLIIIRNNSNGTTVVVDNISTKRIDDSSSHAHTSDNVVLSSSVSIIPQESSHILTSENVVLEFKPVLSVQDSSHRHTAGKVFIDDGIILYPSLVAVELIEPKTYKVSILKTSKYEITKNEDISYVVKMNNKARYSPAIVEELKYKIKNISINN